MGWGVGGGTMAKIITFHVDAKDLHSFIYELTCINSIWLNRVEGRSSVGWWVGWGVGGAKTIMFHVDAKGFYIHSSKICLPTAYG